MCQHIYILFCRKIELPAVDMFVTTADPELEPPIITMNTVLSLLAVDYPVNSKKLACYVSDDAASPVTYYCLVQTSNFAKLWVPFCRKYNVPVRAPFRYFTDIIPTNTSSSHEFQQEWKKMKVSSPFSFFLFEKLYIHEELGMCSHGSFSDTFKLMTKIYIIF